MAELYVFMRVFLTDRSFILVRAFSAVLKPLSRNLVDYRGNVIISRITYNSL